MSDWSAVRTSTPAEHVGGIPDNAYVFAAWTDFDSGDGVAIYKTPDGRYAVVRHPKGEQSLELAPTSEHERAFAKADELVDGVKVRP